MPDQFKDPLKEAFTKVKQDITDLKDKLLSLSEQIQELKQTLYETNKQTNQPTHIPTENPNQPTNQHINPTHKMPLKALKPSNLTFSIRNEGVPTNKQTNKQTNKHTRNEGVSHSKEDLQHVSQILESLDSLKKEVRLKFKRLTEGEMTVFSLIYELEEKGFIVDYPLLATKLDLTEISIRDYTHKIIKKGIPLVKTKENNKKVTLSILQDLKKIASLQTIKTLREI
ncbi:MAG: hypothetical protein AABX73_00755 [Nanoarchaeota archaeon]